MIDTPATLAHLTPHIEEFASYLDQARRESATVVASSSFQTQSMPLLHLISLFGQDIPVHFLDTGFHFAETLAFRNEVRDALGIRVVVLESSIPLISQRTSSGMMLWAQSTQRCCHLNKVLPLEPILAGADVWITGVRKDQSAERSAFEFEMPGANGVTRIHPMLNWTKPDVWRWISEFDLPRHPLELVGYDSIGCSPCTVKPSLDDERGGRWEGQNKTECGLHTTLAKAE